MIRHLLVIGAQRCGTTYLHTMLDAHPQITMARPATPEPKIFISDEATRRGAQWYRETYFAHAGDELLLGEKSTSYLEDPDAPARAAGMLGEVHVLAILRDPVQRAISNWRFSTENGLETRSLETALEENLDGARKAMKDGNEQSAERYAQLAQLDAELAVSKSQTASARKAADELLASIKQLRQEAERTSPTDSQQRTTEDQ